jgi:hypothetical protein
VIFLTSESVKSSALTLEGIDDVHCGDGLPLGVLGVGDGITDDIFQKDLEDSTGLFVDKARDTLDPTATSETTDSGLGDSLDVVPQDFTMPLCASFPEPLASLSTSSHFE